MNSTDKELREWMKYGEIAFKRISPIRKMSVPKKRKVVKKQTSIEGYIVEYDRVINY